MCVIMNLLSCWKPTPADAWPVCVAGGLTIRVFQFAFRFFVDASCLLIGVWCSWSATGPGMSFSDIMLLSSVVMLMLERIKSVWKAIRSMAVGGGGLGSFDVVIGCRVGD